MDSDSHIGLKLHTVALLSGSRSAEDARAQRFMFELALQNGGQNRLVR